jgi:aspartate aminotransferase-like enzyme
MKKFRLFTPGPTMVPEDTLLEMARPIEHHRTPEYRAMAKECHELLQYLFQTKASCLTFTGSGTSAAEAAIVGCCPPGHKALIYRYGKFSERWAEVCAVYNIDHKTVDLDWGTGPKADMVRKEMEADPKIDTVILVHSETSTAALADIPNIAKVTREKDALLLVDGITAVGTLPVKMDEWGVDVYITGSQKALMLPPGLGFAAINDRAWKRVDSGKMPGLYLDLKAYRKSLENFDVPYTPANTLIRGLLVNLRKIKEIGLEQIWRESAVMAKAMRAAAAAVKVKVYPKDPVDSVTALLVPAGVDEGKLRKTMKEKFGFHIAGGQGEVKGKIVRFSHMGYVDVFDTLGAISAFEMTLAELGHKFELGAGVAAAQKVFAEMMK